MSDDEKIDEIMDEFDFDKVRRCMLALGWKWTRLGAVPEIPDLRKCARDLLRRVKGKPLGQEAATGGFRALSLGDNYRLTFEVAYWETCE